MVSKELLELLACPACAERPRVEPVADGTGLLCRGCGRVYPVRDGIPVMLIDEAAIPGAGPAAGAADKPA